MKTTKVFQCLSDGIRLHAMLLVCQHGELCVCELVELLQESQPKVSRHLALLRNCGLLVDQRRGQWVFYSLPDDLPDWARGILADAAAAEAGALSAMQARLDTMAGRPERCAVQANPL